MRIPKLLPDSTKLVCTGTVTVDVNGAPIELPISSEGVLELKDALIYSRPIAPKKALTIKADSEVGHELKLEEDIVKLVQDEADEGYVRQLAQWHEDFLWKIVVQGLTLEFADTKGNEITDFEGQKAVLLMNGITIGHLNTIFEAIVALGTHQAEELDKYIQKSVGITKVIQRKMMARAKKHKGTGNTELYNQTNVMREYHVSPEEWADMHPADKKVLNYTLLLKYHHEAEAMEEQKRKQKLEQNKQRVAGKLPTFGNRGR